LAKVLTFAARKEKKSTEVLTIAARGKKMWSKFFRSRRWEEKCDQSLSAHGASVKLWPKF
jgi:hypothetical protein